MKSFFLSLVCFFVGHVCKCPECWYGDQCKCDRCGKMVNKKSAKK